MTQRNSTGWNPSRRNKKIGTEAQGFKSRNDFGIPSSWQDSRIYWEKLRNPVALPYKLGSHEFTVLIEPCYEDYRYYVSVSDLIEVIRHIPKDHRRDIKVFAFRQPTRKEAIFKGTWGMLAYLADFGKYSGPSVILEAQPLNFTYKVKNNVGADFMQELELLRHEGHEIELTKRYFQIRSSAEAIRNTQLYRTVIHEIGHYVDRLEKVILPGEAQDADDDLSDLYFARPVLEREHFAERYAATIGAEIRSKGFIPFEPRPIAAEHRTKIKPEWFYFAQGPVAP